MTAEALLVSLPTLNIRVRVDGDVVRCKTPNGTEIPADLAEQIRTLKPQLLELLREEEAAIAWRVDSGLLTETVTTRIPGVCSYCGGKMLGNQTGKCVLCCLASAELIARRNPTDAEERKGAERNGSIAHATYPISADFAHESRRNEGLRDMSPDGKEAA